MKCPYCNNDNVHIEKQGFGFGKALIGGALLGPLGLFCGAINKNKLKCTCLNCGRTFSLDEGIKGNVKKSMDNESDEFLYNAALSLIQRTHQVSILHLQKELRIGYNQAIDIVNRLEKNNIITPPDKYGNRQII